MRTRNPGGLHLLYEDELEHCFEPPCSRLKAVLKLSSSRRFKFRHPLPTPYPKPPASSFERQALAGTVLGQGSAQITLHELENGAKPAPVDERLLSEWPSRAYGKQFLLLVICSILEA